MESVDGPGGYVRPVLSFQGHKNDSKEPPAAALEASWRAVPCNADSERIRPPIPTRRRPPFRREGGHPFRDEGGHPFRREGGHFLRVVGMVAGLLSE